jgi:hypothetical protein
LAVRHEIAAVTFAGSSVPAFVPAIGSEVVYSTRGDDFVVRSVARISTRDAELVTKDFRLAEYQVTNVAHIVVKVEESHDVDARLTWKTFSTL